VAGPGTGRGRTQPGLPQALGHGLARPRPEEYTGVLDEGHQVVGGFTDPEKHKERLSMAKDQLPGLTAAAGPRDGDPRDHPLPPAVFPDSPLSA
jgi:hypothetical protein